MKTILASTYALNPYKGSEDGMGWNFLLQIARNNRVIAITRKNNRPHIEKYQQENPNRIYENMEFRYYDLPYILRFWKKGSRGAMPYYYLWQLFIPFFIVNKRLKFDIAHNLNFHNDWTPSLLWVFGKPMVWGPIGHHPKIPKAYLKPIYGKKAARKDQMTWVLKQFFWKIDPLVKLTKHQANQILCMNHSVQQVLHLNANKTHIMPSVASEDVSFEPQYKDQFNVLSIGRFVPLKGFDVTIRSFAKFIEPLTKIEKAKTHLTLVGSGPEKDFLGTLSKDLGIYDKITFIEWIERSKLTEIYQQASVFLFPSHEGAGMVVAEALSHGLPVICFDNSGPGEFITDECGRKVGYSNYEESTDTFALHLVSLFMRPEMRMDMSKKAREHFEKHFLWDRRGDKLAKVYESLFTNKKVVEKTIQLEYAHSKG